MPYETISRLLYLHLVEDGVRVDRVRELVKELREEIRDAPDLQTKKCLRETIKRIETALMDTPAQIARNRNKQIKIRLAELGMQ